MTHKRAALPGLFDTWGHKFGMAYRMNNGAICYVGNFSHSLGFMIRELDQETGEIGREYSISRSRTLRRAPEYDLVPANTRPQPAEGIEGLQSRHDALVKAAKTMKAALVMLVVTHEITCKGEECQISGIDFGKQALNNFTAWEKDDGAR